MQKTNFKRLLCFLTALSMVMSMVILPAAAEEGSEHICEYTQETILANPTCNVAGSKKLSCTCGEYIEEGIPATNQHTYDQGVCSVCGAEKICTGTADCDAPTHVSCLSQCNLHVSCPSNVHKEGCLKDQACTCVQSCSENMACPVCQDGGVCTGGAAAENITRVQALIDALPASYNLSQAEQMKAQYDACTAQITALPEYQRAALTLTKYNAAATPTVIDNVHSIFVGNTGYSSLEEAIAAANETDVIKLKAGTYTLPATLAKDLKIQALDGVAAKDIIIDLGKTSNTTSAENIDVSFTGVTLKRPEDSTAQGFQGMASETYTNCIIAGQYWAFAKTAAFTGCTFKTTSTANYNVHTHLAESVSFNNCTFACAGKSVKIYNEGTNGTNATFTGCKFTAEPSVAGTAIEIDSSKLATQTKNKIFSVSISRGNDTVTGFVKNDTVTNTLWTNKGDLTEVTINGGKALTIKPTADTLPVLVNVKNEIILEDDVTLTKTLIISKPVTINLNGKTITNAVESDSLFHITDYITEQVKDSVTICNSSNSMGSIVSGENSEGILLTNEGSVNLTSGSFDGKVISNGENAVTSISGGTYSNFAAEMTEGGLVVIAGGTFKTGDTVTDVSSYLTLGYAQDSTGKVNTATIASKPAEEKVQITVSDNINSSVPSSVIDNDAAANVNITGSISNDIIKDTVAKITDAIGASSVVVSLKLEIADYNDTNDSTLLLFNVTPHIQPVDKDDNPVGNGAAVSETTNAITFCLPMPDGTKGKIANVQHEHEEGKPNFVGAYQIQGLGEGAESTKCYIELESKQFSKWQAKILKNVTTIEAEVEGIPYATLSEALSAVNTSGGTLKLLNDVITDKTASFNANKNIDINLNKKTYTYTATGAAFENNAAKLVLGGGIVKATNGGTLVKNNTGTLEISGITFTSTTGSGETAVPSTTGNTIDIIDGTATISSGNRFSGNDLSLRVSPDKKGSATINGSTFNKGVEGNITIHDGTFNGNVKGNITIHDGTFNGNVEGKVIIYGGTFKQNVETSETIPGTIPGNNKLNTAVFHSKPDAEIESHYQIVETKNGDNTVYVIAENPHVIVTIGTNDPSKLYYNDSIKNLDDVIEKTSNLVSVKLTRDEEIKHNHQLINTLTIYLDGKKISGSGSIIPKAGTSKLSLLNVGKKVKLELENGDKVVFDDDKIITTAVENTKNEKNYGYGEIKFSFNTTSYTYFLGASTLTQPEATFNVYTATGNFETSGHVLPPASNGDYPNYLISEMYTSDSTSPTNNFVMKSSYDMIIISNGFYRGFNKIMVNNKKVDEKYYTVTELDKGFKITLKNAYLKTLSKGTYPLTLHFNDGGSTKNDNLYVVEAAKATTTPKTGDPIMSAVFGMNASAAALGALLFLGKKKKK